MIPWILAACIGVSAGADIGTTHQAMNRGAREAWIPSQQAWVIDSAVAGGSGVAAYGVQQLWKSGHHQKAIWITVAVVGVHGLAAWHNIGVR